MKGPNSSIRFNVNKKEEQKALHTMAHGWDSRVSLPEFINIQNAQIIQGNFIMVKGSNEFLSNLDGENREIKTSVRIAKPGLVVSKGTIDNQELRLPWQNMTHSTYKSNSIIVDLDNNQTMKFTGIPLLRNVRFSVKYVSDYINDQIKNVE